MRSGPLTNLKIIEFSGIGPVPFCGMLLADLGAHVIRVDRKTDLHQTADIAAVDAILGRGRRSIALNLKRPESTDICLRLMDDADAVIEGFRPGVMERLGLGPDTVRARNGRLVYGRMTGWGQTGPMSALAGHDINYIGLTGALAMIGTAERPVPPLNLVGDFGGGALYLALGLVAAILNARETGIGQVIDCAITDGTASLMAMLHALNHSGRLHDRREANLLDGGAPFYGVYACSDGQWMAVGSIEPQFYRKFRELAGLDGDEFADPHDRNQWPALRIKVAERFMTKTRAEWTAIFVNGDCCVTPVLSLAEAPLHPHNAARSTYSRDHGVVQPSPAPRFSATPGSIHAPAPQLGADTEAILSTLGMSLADINALRQAGAI